MLRETVEIYDELEALGRPAPDPKSRFGADTDVITDCKTSLLTVGGPVALNHGTILSPAGVA
jgi:hypothetical protein